MEKQSITYADANLIVEYIADDKLDNSVRMYKTLENFMSLRKKLVQYPQDIQKLQSNLFGDILQISVGSPAKRLQVEHLAERHTVQMETLVQVRNLIIIDSCMSCMHAACKDRTQLASYQRKMCSDIDAIYQDTNNVVKCMTRLLACIEQHL